MLRDLIPARYYNTPELCELFHAIDISMEGAQAAIEDFFKQLNIEAATWALALYERDYGLTPNVSASDTERRAQIKSRMRIAGASTLAMLENITAAYSGGETAIEDRSELFTRIVTFLDTIGVPKNMADLEAAVAEAKPARMAVRYIIRYNLWSAVKALTWGTLETRTWQDVKEATL